MPKQLIIESCLINFNDDAGGVHCDAGEVHDIPKDTAFALSRAGRTLYVDKADDADKSARYTASAEMLKAAAALAKARAKEEATQPPA